MTTTLAGVEMDQVLTEEMLTHELIGKLALGIDFDDPQR